MESQTDVRNKAPRCLTTNQLHKNSTTTLITNTEELSITRQVHKLQLCYE